MPITDLFRDEKITGIILNKYKLKSGNIGVIVEDEDYRRYSIEFKTDSTGPCYDNLYGFINEPFKGKGDYIDKLINNGNYVEMTVSYTKGPVRNAYRLHSVSSRPLQITAYNRQPRYSPL